MTPPCFTTLLPDEHASAALGERIADLIATGFTAHANTAAGGFTIHFSGELGAGKTTIVRALLRRLGVTGRIRSPTYTLVEPYDVQLQKSVESRQRMNLYCYHFDFYRFEDPREWLEAGFRDYFSDAVLRLVEWPERAQSGAGSLPVPDLHVALTVEDDGRSAAVANETPLGALWLSHASLAAPSRPPTDARADDC